MKNLPALVMLAATAVLVALAAAAVAGVTFPYWTVTLQVAAFAWAAGMLAVFVADYAPRRTGPAPTVAPAAAPRRAPEPAARSVPADAFRVGAMATLGLGNNPATLSLS